MKKKFLSSVLLCFLIVFSFCLAGCGSVNAMIVSNTDGSIEEIVTVKLDSEYLQSVCDIKRVLELRDDISTNGYNEAKLFNVRLNQKINNMLSRTDLTEEAKEILESYIDGIEATKTDWNQNEIKIGIKFRDEDVYKFYYSITNNQSEAIVEKSFWTSKVIFQGYTMYAKHFELYTILKDYYTTNYPEIVLTEQGDLSGKLLYTYTTESHREHSNADYVYKIDGKYYHTWIITDEQAPIEMYYTIANSYNWIIISVAVSLAIGLIIVPLAVVLRNKRLKKIEKANTISNQQ